MRWGWAGLLLSPWAAIPVAVTILMGVVFVAGWCKGGDDRDDGYEREPARIDTVKVTEYLPDPSPSIIESVRIVRVPVAATGVAPIDTSYVNEFVRRALEAATGSVPDSLRKAPIFPLMRVETEKEEGIKVGLQRSDGVYEVRDFPTCKHPCQVHAQDTTMVSFQNRRIPGLQLLPDIGQCAGVGGVSSGIAWAVGASTEQIIGAGVAGAGGCAVIKMVN